jgi:exosortase A-associated hydrolase 2
MASLASWPQSSAAGSAPAFIAGGDGQPRFSLFHAPHSALRGSVLHVHAFAEEMNKSRRMAAEQARRLAAHGFAVLQIDLKGCGDSAGDFEDATWLDWVDDVLAGVRWLQQRNMAPPGLPLWLWGHRAGCLLAAEAARRLSHRCELLFWQPVSSGRQHLQQFLRLKIAGALAKGEGKASTDGLRQALAAGEAVEVAGYTLAPALAAGMEAATLTSPSPTVGRLIWLDVSSTVGDPSPAARQTLRAWSDAGWQAEIKVVTGAAFWQTTEIEVAPALWEATLAALTALPPLVTPTITSMQPA